MKLPSLTPREKLVVSCAGIALALIVVYLLVDSVVQGYRKLDEKILVEREEVKKVSRLCQQYEETHQELDRIKVELDKQKKGFSLLSFIEDLANRQNMRENIGSVKPKKLPVSDNYEETLVEMEINDVTLSKLVDFIFKIENSGHVLKVKRLRIKTRYNNPSLLYGTMQVSTYTKKA